MPPAVRLPKPVQMVLMSLGSAAGSCRTRRSATAPCSPSMSRSSAAAWSSPIPRWRGRCSSASTDDLINVQPNLSRIFGPGSVFALDGKRAPGPPQAARPAVPRPEHQELREGHRRGDAARDRDLARGRRVPDARTDEQDHAERHPAHRVRGRRRGTRLPARDHPAVGQAGVADGHPAGAAVQHGPLQPVGPARGVPPQLRPHRLRADRQGRSRPAPRRARPTSWRCCCAAGTRTARRCRARTSPTNC